MFPVYFEIFCFVWYPQFGFWKKYRNRKWESKTTPFRIHVYKKKETGSQPGLPGSPGFCRANSQTGFYLDPDRFQARVGRVPGWPAEPVRVLKLWFPVGPGSVQSNALNRSNSVKKIIFIFLIVFYLKIKRK